MLDLFGKKRVVQVTWDGSLLISKGDKVEITKGIVDRANNIRASKLTNLSNGRDEVSRIEGVLMTVMPVDINPPITGFVQEIHGSSGATVFMLAEEIGTLEMNLTKLLKEIEPCLDKEIIEKCIHKTDAEDIVTGGFRVLEERIRAKIGADPSSHGVDLIDEAFNPDKGKLIFGKTAPERLGTFMLFRGSFLIFRNPPSHRYLDEYIEFEIFEIAMLANLLLSILDKSQLRKP